MRATLFHSALKISAIREVPEGLCGDCNGTGQGEEIADLGEANFHYGESPIKNCKSCGGTGMAIAMIKVTALGFLLLFLISLNLAFLDRHHDDGP